MNGFASVIAAPSQLRREKPHSNPTGKTGMGGVKKLEPVVVDPASN
jgi:hypothetical protein